MMSIAAVSIAVAVVVAADVTVGGLFCRFRGRLGWYCRGSFLLFAAMDTMLSAVTSSIRMSSTSIASIRRTVASSSNSRSSHNRRRSIGAGGFDIIRIRINTTTSYSTSSLVITSSSITSVSSVSRCSRMIREDVHGRRR